MAERRISIKPETHAALCKVVQGQVQGDAKSAEAELLRQYEPMIINLASKIPRDQLEIEDALQVARIAVIRAVRLFDPNRSVKLSTYIYYSINRNLWRAAWKNSLIRLPMHIWRDLGRIKRAEEELQHILGRSPTPSEIALHTGMTEEAVNERLRWNHRIYSLNHTIEAQGDIGETIGCAIDTVPDSNPCPHDLIFELDEELLAALNAVTDRQRDVICRRFGLPPYTHPQTYEEISRELGVSHQAIEEQEKRALRRIREALGVNEPESCLP